MFAFISGFFYDPEPLKYKFGYNSDILDERDLWQDFKTLTKYIKTVDLRDQMPPIFDQGKLGSCTSNALSALYQFDEIKQEEKKQFTPSRLFIYFNGRVMENTVDKDAGESIRDGVKTMNRDGVVPEEMWPYDISKFTTEPTEECYDLAKSHKAVVYKRVKQTLHQLIQCVCEGFPIAFGFQVFQSFLSIDATGLMPMPLLDEQKLGGHATVICGFDKQKKVFIVRNSWGESWGDKGYFYMPFEFACNDKYCADFWTIRRVD